MIFLCLGFFLTVQLHQIFKLFLILKKVINKILNLIGSDSLAKSLNSLNFPFQVQILFLEAYKNPQKFSFPFLLSANPCHIIIQLNHMYSISKIIKNNIKRYELDQSKHKFDQ